MKERNIGLDLLRILLALMVVTLHLIWGGGEYFTTTTNGDTSRLFSVLKAFCYPAVNIYILISGYFSYAHKKAFPQILKSLLKLWLCLLFAQLCGYAATLIVSFESFNILTLVKHFFPLSRGIWWFMSVYFVLMLLSPALNWVIDNLSKREYIFAMACALLVCSIIPFFARFESPLGLSIRSGGLIWFIVLYLTGGGLFKYYSNESQLQNNRFSLLAIGGYFILTIYLFLSPRIHDAIGIGHLTSFAYNSIIVYAQAVLLFLCFRGIQVKSIHVSRAISFIAGLSLAAYIYHCQEDIIRYFWQYIRPGECVYGVRGFLLFSSFVLGVYLISVSIELMRRKVFSIYDFENRIVNRALGLFPMVIER